MTVNITGGEQVFPEKVRSVKSYTVSTASAVQTMDPDYDVHNLGMSTEAASFLLNRYLLATDNAYEGRTVYIQATATGSANVIFSGTSTGALVLTAATDVVRVRQFNGTWHLEQNSGATIATATGTV